MLEPSNVTFAVASARVMVTLASTSNEWPSLEAAKRGRALPIGESSNFIAIGSMVMRWNCGPLSDGICDASSNIDRSMRFMSR